MPVNPIDLFTYLDDVAEVTANPNPDRPVENAVGSAMRAVCQSWSNAPEWARVLTGPSRTIIGTACKPYLDSLGNSQPVVSDPGFSGGQCAGVSYRVTLTSASAQRIACSGSSTPFTDELTTPLVVNSLTGPISSIELQPGGTTQFCSRTGTNIPTGVRLVIGHGGGTSTSTVLGAANSATLESFDFTVSVERMDGAPDTCGDPPELFEPGPNPFPSPPTLDPTEEPFDDPTGGPFLPMPPISLPGFPDVELPNPFEPPGGVGGPTDQQPLPGEPIEGVGSGEGGGDTPFGEPPEGTRWAGACVNLTLLPEGLGVIPSSIPENVFAEVVGNARLYIENDSQNTYDSPTQLRSQTVCCWEPVRGLRPVGMRVNLKPLFEYTVTPYYVPLEET